MRHWRPFRLVGNRRRKFWLVFALSATAVVGIVAAMGVIVIPELSRRAILRQLPPVPDLCKEPKALVDAIHRADSDARDDPFSVEKIGQLGMMYHANDMFDQAKLCYETAVKLSPVDFRWNYYLALVNEEIGREDRAIELLRRAIELVPEYIAAKARLGTLLLRNSRVQEARTTFEDVLNHDPLQPDACLGMARILARERNWRNVISTLEPTLEVNPMFGPAVRLLSRAYRQVGRADLREEQLDKTVLVEKMINEPLLDAIYDYSVLAFLKGHAQRGKGLVRTRCTKCHVAGRIEEAEKKHREWLHTIRRMQYLAGPDWLSDQEAADVLSYLGSNP